MLAHPFSVSDELQEADYGVQEGTMELSVHGDKVDLSTTWKSLHLPASTGGLTFPCASLFYECRFWSR